LTLVNKKIAVLKELNNKATIEELQRTYSEKELLSIFNDIVIRNVDKKEEIKKNNKLLLEKFILMGREYKNNK
jgi:hypothetical protein